jgi:hypothetical protein
MNIKARLTTSLFAASQIAQRLSNFAQNVNVPTAGIHTQLSMARLFTPETNIFDEKYKTPNWFQMLQRTPYALSPDDPIEIWQMIVYLIEYTTLTLGEAQPKLWQAVKICSRDFPWILDRFKSPYLLPYGSLVERPELLILEWEIQSLKAFLISEMFSAFEKRWNDQYRSLAFLGGVSFDDGYSMLELKRLCSIEVVHQALTHRHKTYAGFFGTPNPLLEK